MKALLRKDFYVLKSALGLYAAIVVLINLYAGLSSMIFTVLYAALLPSSAFAYDDKSRWGELAAMLPYSEREIVCSRYLLGAAGAVLFNALGALGRLISGALSSNAFAGPSLSASFSMTALLSVCFLDLTLPVYFRFDAEKSRLVRVITIFVFSALIGGIYALAGFQALGAYELSDASGLLRLSYAPLFALTVILTAVSIPLSLWAYRARKK